MESKEDIISGSKLDKEDLGHTYEIECQGGNKCFCKKFPKSLIDTNLFKRELEILKSKTCENSIKLFSNFEEDENDVIISELCDKNLDVILFQRERGFTSHEIYDILTELNNAFKYMNENKIIHRDIKLKNIMVKYYDSSHEQFIYKLNFYGLSRFIKSRIKSTKYSRISEYIAPEIYLGKKYEEKTDLWSIGIMIYFLHFKEFPFDYPSSFDSLRENQIKEIFDRNKKNNSSDKKLDDLINKLLIYNPENRITWNEYFNHRFFKKNKLKVVLLGESGVKKTNIIYSFAHNFFVPDELTSHSSSFVSKSIEFDEFKESIKIDVWDSAGQEKYRPLVKIFYLDADAICLCYDITSKKSFNELKEYWYEKEVKLYAKNNPILAVVATNAELYEYQRVRDEEGKEFAKSINGIFTIFPTNSHSHAYELFKYIGYKYLNPDFQFDEEEKKEKLLYEQKKAQKRRGVKLENHKKLKKKKNCIIF